MIKNDYEYFVIWLLLCSTFLLGFTFCVVNVKDEVKDELTQLLSSFSRLPYCNNFKMF